MADEASDVQYLTILSTFFSFFGWGEINFAKYSDQINAKQSPTN